MDPLLADGAEHRLGAREGRRGRPGHDEQRALLRAVLAPGDRRLDEVHPQRACPLLEAPRLLRPDGAEVHQQLPAPRRRKSPSFPSTTSSSTAGVATQLHATSTAAITCAGVSATLTPSGPSAAARERERFHTVTLEALAHQVARHSASHQAHPEKAHPLRRRRAHVAS